MDDATFEVVSSTCTVVGFFVGYSVALAKDTTEVSQSRKRQAEMSVDWGILPPPCRKGKLEERNVKLEEKRDKAKAERASESGNAIGFADPHYFSGTENSVDYR